MQEFVPLRFFLHIFSNFLSIFFSMLLKDITHFRILIQTSRYPLIILFFHLVSILISFESLQEKGILTRLTNKWNCIQFDKLMISLYNKRRR